MDYPINGHFLMNIVSAVGALANQHWGDESLSISASEDERCIPERFSFISLGPSHTFIREELKGA